MKAKLSIKLVKELKKNSIKYVKKNQENDKELFLLYY